MHTLELRDVRSMVAIGAEAAPNSTDKHFVYELVASLKPEIAEWCSAHISNHYEFGYKFEQTTARMWIDFEHEEDMVMFKLRWF